jgi:DNA-binding PadR family transcriptional regulator
MSTRLVILGILRGQPLHGYEIKQVIEEHMGDWTSIAFGSIYFALARLTEEGLVEKAGTEQEGGRPSRTIYRITPAGQEEFLRLLRAVWREPERHYYAIDLGLAFMEALPLQEIKEYLRQRVAALEKTVDHVEEHQTEQLAREEVPRIAAAIFTHNLAHFRAELEWTKELLARVERGGLP